MATGNVLFFVRRRELTGRPICLAQFKGMRHVRLHDLKRAGFFMLSDGRRGLGPVVHRLSHDSTKIVGVVNYPHSVEMPEADGEIIIYELVPPTHACERMRLPMSRMSLRSVLYSGFNEDSSIFCAVTAFVTYSDSSKINIVEPLKIQFGLLEKNLCLSLTIQSWVESFSINKKNFSDTMLMSYGNLFVMNYNGPQISIFGFYDYKPVLRHAKIYEIQCLGPRELNRLKKLRFDFVEGSLEVSDMYVTDGSNRYDWLLAECSDKVNRPNSTYFTQTHIDLQLVFMYACEHIIRSKDPHASCISCYKCQPSVLQIESNSMLYIYLPGIVHIRMSKSPPFLVAAFLIMWDLKTNFLNYKLIGSQLAIAPIFPNLIKCPKECQSSNFFDQMQLQDLVFIGTPITTITSHHGDITLCL